MNVLNSASGRARVFPVLDAIRGIAALLVVQRHAAPLFAMSAWPATHLAVDLFFLMSGFVIAHSYDEKLAMGLKFKSFMLIRIIRLYPLYLVGLILGVIVEILLAESNLQQVILGTLSAIFMILWTSFPMLNDPRWSLTFEVLINAIYAAIFRYLNDMRLVILTGFGSFLLIAFGIENDTIDGGWDFGEFLLGVGRVTFSFFAGIILQRIYNGYFSPRHLIAIVLFNLVAVIFATTCVRINLAAHFMIILFVFPIMTYCSLFLRIPSFFVSFCSFLGMLSYAIYIIHAPLVRLFLTFDAHPGVISVLYVFVLVAACVALHNWFDKPVRSYFRKLFENKRAALRENDYSEGSRATR